MIFFRKKGKGTGKDLEVPNLTPADSLLLHEAYQYLVKRYITEKKDIGTAKKTKEKKTSKSSTKSATEEMEQLSMKENSSEDKSSGESEGDEENK